MHLLKEMRYIRYTNYKTALMPMSANFVNRL